MIILGYVLSILIGLLLGLIGGGGAILTIPLVTYFFSVEDYNSTTYSLVVVTMAALFGVLQRTGQGLFAIKESIVFLIPSAFVAYVFRVWLMPNFPDAFYMGDFELSRQISIKILLVVLMVFIGIRLLVSKGRIARDQVPMSKVVLYGIITGVLAGFLGAGGGFIIVPILIGLGLDTKKAVATSMLIVSIQSAIALAGDFMSDWHRMTTEINWLLVGILSGLTVAGVWIGTKLQYKLTGLFLKRLFGVVLLLVGCFIAIQTFLI